MFSNFSWLSFGLGILFTMFLLPMLQGWFVQIFARPSTVQARV